MYTVRCHNWTVYTVSTVQYKQPHVQCKYTHTAYRQEGGGDLTCRNAAAEDRRSSSGSWTPRVARRVPCLVGSLKKRKKCTLHTKRHHHVHTYMCSHNTSVQAHTHALRYM